MSFFTTHILHTKHDWTRERDNIVLRRRTGWCTFSLFLFLFRWASCCQRNNARRRTPHRLRSRRAWDSALFLLLESCCGRCTRLGVTVDTLGSVEWEDMGRVWYVLQSKFTDRAFLTLVCLFRLRALVFTDRALYGPRLAVSFE